MGLKKKHVALCVDLLSYLEKKNSVERVLLAMCYCISSFPHEVVTYKKRRQSQDLLEGSCKSTIILLQINIKKAVSGDFNRHFLVKYK